MTELRYSLRRFSLRHRLCFAFFTISTRFSNEQTVITEGSHKIWQIVMRFSLIQVGDAIRRAQWGVQMPGTSECFTRITTLIRAHMWVVLQIERQALFKLA